MAANKAVWGIDLGQASLKAIRLEASGDTVQVVDHFYHDHPKLLSQPDVDRQSLITEAMNAFAEKHDLSKEGLVVGVPGQSTLARFTKLPPVDKKKIPEIVKFEAQQQIPFDMDEVIWDYQIFDSSEAGETSVGIFAMRRDLLRDHLRFLSVMNLEPAAVQANPLALYNALKFDGLLEGGEAVAVIDIGTQNTDLIVADGNSLWTRNIPIGGNNFTEALVKTFKLSFRKAENLKRDAAKSKYARQIFQAMRPVFADLVAEVQRSIGFFTSSRRGVTLGKFMAMGSAFKLPGLQKFMQQNLGLDVVRPTNFSKLDVSQTPKAPQLMDHLMSFGVAYGLALQGLGQAPITSNLLPPEIAKQVIWRKKTPWFYGAVATLALSAGVVWAVNMSQTGTVQAAGGTVSTEGGGVRPPSFSIQYDANDEKQENPQPDPRAVQIAQNGPSNGSAVAKAQEVLAATQHLNQVLNQIKNMNQEMIEQVESLAQLHAQKTVWPEILTMLHNSLPAGNRIMLREINEGGPAAYQQWAAENPRGEREQVFIKKYEVKYSRDVKADYQQIRDQRKGGGTSARSSGSTGMDTGGMEPPQEGFVISLIGQTPNQKGYDFLKRSFFSNLERQKSDSVYLANVDLILTQRLEERFKEEGGGSSYNNYGGGGGDNIGSGRFGPPGGGSSSRGTLGGGIGSRNYGGSSGSDGMSANPAKREGLIHKDPVTGESTLKDIEFEIVFMAVLGDKDAQADPNSGQPLAADTY